jgi:enoyl-CoA hydratase/carnithine racemase
MPEVEVSRDGGVQTITLNRPDKLNAFTQTLHAELHEALEQARDPAVRAVVITGAGRGFSAGQDLTAFGEGGDVAAMLRATYHVNVMAIRSLEKPVIAAVNGWAAGAGLYILLSSTDIRIASREHARFKFALLSQGWLGHGPGASLLIRQLRYIDAMKILLTDDPFDADEALRIGLVNEVVPHAQLMERAEKIARHIVTLPPVAVRMMKEFVIRFGDLPTDQAWHVQNLINSLLIQTTTDGEEGRQAFNEKRQPNFTGALRRRGGAWEEPPEEDAKRLDEAYRSGEF